MKVSSLFVGAVLTGSAFGLVPGVPGLPGAANAVPSNIASGVSSVIAGAASSAASAVSSAVPAAASSGLANASSRIASAASAQSTGKKIQLTITTANSRGATGVSPKVIATVLLDTATDILSTLSVPGIPFLKRRLSQRRQEVELSKRAMPPLRWQYYQSSPKIRGVNLGGWLVLEAWMTPSVFAATGNPNIVDEWGFGSMQPRDQAISIMQNHLNTFMSESDIQQIAAAGLNHVRIPIPYWAFEVAAGEPYLKLNQYDLLKQAVMLCNKYNIKVLVELHTAPGSQNGYDHGGRRGVNQWASNPSYVNRTIAILQTMSQEFSQSKYANVVTAIELLNEPVTDQNVVMDFNARAYEVVRYPNGRNATASPLLIVLSDDFISPAVSAYWNQSALPPQYEAVSIDSHVYTVFSDQGRALSNSDRLAYYCSLKPKWAGATTIHPQIIGEWTPAYTDCAAGVNGRNTAAGTSDCYARSGDASTFTPAYKAMLGKMWEAQVDSAEGGKGWMMWSWKTEAMAAEDWSYQKGLQYGWIPRDPTKRPQGINCNLPSTYNNVDATTTTTSTAQTQTKSSGGGFLGGIFGF
ncbi:exo-beta-1,3-glucanase [Pseudozyma hubeiensis SY62]|uniref:Exo-beta-1,3-glucanase n=1 Tax=Pseudozyma hubeiensis (strain SY62) TaxID=1305764 RepID=R9P9J1_PSEHS|nr:exo-beta-1,3-glucanase [Pseudozyma hubeiensis SY62]GAC98058.1 exo-beta-1,3-glucanase [Pseudozyma hubeiensis SY62]